MTSATERLRALLDERGADYRVSSTGYSIDIGPNVTAYANRTDTTLDVSLRGLTPEQAVEATLGRGTCKRVFYEPTGVYVCSECGCGLSKKLDKYCYLRYCPNCGRAVEP